MTLPLAACPDVVLVLAKAPVPGQAKTRLCPPITPIDAARIAAAALLDTLDAARAVPGARPMVAWTGTLDPAEYPAEYAAELRLALADVEVFGQCSGELGQRIVAAHREVVRRAPGSAVLQIGMDTPQLGSGELAAALERLRAMDGTAAAVLGPALDGGWWALGLRDPARAGVLADVPMSRPNTGELTRKALVAAGLIVTALRVVRDVDTAADACAVAIETPQGRFAAEVRARLEDIRCAGGWH